MECRECGAEVQVGTFFCGGCGRPVWASDSEPACTEEAPDLASLPTPGRSREAARPVVRGESFFVCAGCMGSHPLRDAHRVGGRNYCSACAPASDPRSSGTVALPTGLLVRERDLGGLSRFWLIGGLLAILAVGVAFALPRLRGGDRIDRLCREASEDGAGRFTLAARYRPGQTLAYDLRLRLSVEARGDGMDGALPEGTCEVRGTLWVEVLSVDEAGNADLRVRTEEVTAVGPDGGEPPPGFSPPPGIGDLEAILHLDPWGAPVEAPEVISGDPSLADNLFRASSGVPRRELGVGETWTCREDLPLGPLPTGGDGRVGMESSYRVQGMCRHLGRDCAVVSFAGEVDGDSAGLDFGGLLDMDISASMKGVGFIERETGVLVKNACDVSVDLAISADGNSAEVGMHLELDLDLR